VELCGPRIAKSPAMLRSSNSAFCGARCSQDAATRFGLGKFCNCSCSARYGNRKRAAAGNASGHKRKAAARAQPLAAAAQERPHWQERVQQAQRATMLAAQQQEGAAAQQGRAHRTGSQAAQGAGPSQVHKNPSRCCELLKSYSRVSCPVWCVPACCLWLLLLVCCPAMCVLFITDLCMNHRSGRGGSTPLAPAPKTRRARYGKRGTLSDACLPHCPSPAMIRSSYQTSRKGDEQLPRRLLGQGVVPLEGASNGCLCLLNGCVTRSQRLHVPSQRLLCTFSTAACACSTAAYADKAGRWI